MSNADGDFDIYVLYLNTDEQKLIKLTDAPGQDGMPVWSPDGSEIAFRSIRDGHSQIYVMNSDGSNQVNISNIAFTVEYSTVERKAIVMQFIYSFCQVLHAAHLIQDLSDLKNQ